MDTEDDYVDDLVSKAGPKMGGDDEEAEGEGDMGDEAAYTSAVRDFVNATKAGKVEDAAAALKDAIRNCK